MKNYRIKYSLQPGLFTREDLGEQGGCDQLLLCSVIDNPDGSGSYKFASSNGELPYKEMEADKQLKCLVLLAHELSESPDLGPGARAFCENIFETYRTAILESRDG